jgi:hypothetical protein
VNKLLVDCEECRVLVGYNWSMVEKVKGRREKQILSANDFRAQIDG